MGVVEHARHGSVLEDALPTIYMSGVARAAGASSWHVAFRSQVGVAEAAASVRERLREVDPGATLSNARAMDDRVREALAVREISAALFLGFAAASILVSVIGLYGLLSMRVSERRREYGIRQSLGARRSTLVRSVLLEGAKLGSGGLAIGALVRLALGRPLRGALFGVQAHDPVVLGAAGLVVHSVVALASTIPAVRATTVDAAVALRARE